MKSIPKIVCGAFTMYLSLVILIGYYLDYLGFSLRVGKIIVPLLAIFLCYIGSNIVLRRPLFPYESDKTYAIIFFAVLLVGFIEFLLPSLPSFLPLGSNVDAGQAYAITKLIADSHSLLLHGHIYSEDCLIWNIYPFGMHLNVAVLSWISNIPPIKLIYPFMCLIASISAAAIYGIVVESKITENKYLATIPSFLLLTFVLLNLQMRLGGTWPMIFGLFLIVMFVWFLMDYIKKPSSLSLIPLILIECALILSYTSFAVIPITIFVFALIFDVDRRRVKISHLILFSGIVIILTLSYLLTFYDTFTYLLHTGQTVLFKQPDIMRIRIMPFNWWRSDESIYVNLANVIATLFYIVSVPGAVMYFTDKRARVASLFYGVTLLQIFSFLALGFLIGLRLTTVNRSFYILMYPAAIFIFLGIKKYLDIENASKKFSVIVLACIILLTPVAGYIMSIGCATGLTGREAGITQDEYDTALWVKNNVAGDVAVITDPGAQLFVVIASERKNITSGYTAYHQSELDDELQKWVAQAKSGDIVVVLDIYKVGSVITLYPDNTAGIDGNTYEILYHKGNCYVLRYL